MAPTAAHVIATGLAKTAAVAIWAPAERIISGTQLLTNQLNGVGGDKYYVPGSVLRVSVDNTNPIAHGFEKELDVFFDNNPVFKLNADAASKGVKPVTKKLGPSRRGRAPRTSR